MTEEPSEVIQTILKKLVDEFNKEDTSVRERQIIFWKKFQYMWEGFQRLWWSEIAHDWRNFNSQNAEGYDDQAAFYDKPVNVFRAFLETIIAAMSAEVPVVGFTPDDADNNDDVLTAIASSKISKLINKHNDAPLLWIKALYIYCTNGMIAAYHYPDEDESYGTVKVNEYKDVEESVTQYTCPVCKKELEGPELENAINQDLEVSDEFMPETEEVNGTHLCQNCQQLVNPEKTESTIKVRRMVGQTTEPKSRQCIEVYGGLYVKIPNYVKKAKDLPYVNLSQEKHYSYWLKKYPNLVGNKRVTSGVTGDLYERWGRLSPQYAGEYPMDTPTESIWWFPISSYNVLDEKDKSVLEKKYPSGVKVAYVNDEFACAENENLHDVWTFTENPLSEFLHFTPLGDTLVSVQEITNDLISLILQTIEHGIPQTFFDTGVLNANQYKQMEAAPGAMIPAKAKSGKSLQDGFYTTKTATLSQEVMPFGDKITELGQFTSGALPSLYGGDQGNSSRTAAQYSMSRAQSLQRLQVGYKMLNFWWKNIFGKVVPAYIKTMQEDERLVEKQGNSFVNTVIRRSELTGKLGSVELESSDQIPFTFGQKRDVVVQLLQSTNPAILEGLADPNNLPLIAEALGLTDFKLPGADDREKQLDEITMLVKTQPIDEMTPSVMPELEVDNHEVEAAICRTWLISENGREAKVMNQAGYMNVLLHMKMHIMMLQSLQVPEAEGDNKKDESNPKKEAPLGQQQMETSNAE